MTRYVVHKYGLIKEISAFNFKSDLKELFYDCQLTAGKVSRGDYLFADMAEIIKDYNHCTNQYCDHSSTAEQVQ